VLTFLAPLVLFAAQGVAVPANDGWVTDQAGLLSASQERALEDLMESYRQGTTHEIAVLTVPKLQGVTIERLALETARAWGIGTGERNNGALLVVAKDDRALRIEVGRGLEGNLTDSISGRIIRDVIAPEFRSGDYFGGIHAGVQAMHAAIGGNYGALPRSSAHQGRSAGGVVCLMLLFMLFVFLRSVSGHRRMGGTGGVLPWLVMSSMLSGHHRGGGFSGGGGFSSGGSFGGFGGGGGFSGGGASGGW
jgi:uncharacterized protein